MKMNLSQIADYFYKNHGGKLCIVHIFDDSPMMSFSLSGEMMISRNVAEVLARIFAVMTPLMMHPDIELKNINK